MQRSSEEYILMTLSFGGAISITPFAIIRLLNGEWAVALVDSVMVIGMLMLGVFVYISRKTGFASQLLTVLALSGVVMVIYLKGSTLVYWAYPTMVGVYYLLVPRQAFFLTTLATVAIAAVLLNQMTLLIYIAVIMTMFVNNIFTYVFATKMHQQQALLSQLVKMDPLTGAGNRRALDEKLAELIALIKRSKQAASLVVLDVDHFKNINDNYGHAVGDEVLVNITRLINSRIRETDCLYRFGGEEFVVVTVGASLNAAEQIAEDLRVIIEANQLVDDKVVTISLGVAAYIDGETAEDWITRGDKAMYMAKDSGRNRTCLAE